MHPNRKPYPNERPGLRFRRVLGESLVREMQRIREDVPDASLFSINVDFNDREGKTLATLSLVDAMRAIQFNVTHGEKRVDWTDAAEALVWIDNQAAGG